MKIPSRCFDDGISRAYCELALVGVQSAEQAELLAAGAIIKSGRKLVLGTEKHTRTLKNRIVLAEDWSQKPVWRRARTLAHELVHVRQQDRMFGFFVRYLRPAFALTCEWQGYAEGLRATLDLGRSDQEIIEYVEGVGEKLFGYVHLRVYGRDQLVDASTRMMLQALRQYAPERYRTVTQLRAA